MRLAECRSASAGTPRRGKGPPVRLTGYAGRVEFRLQRTVRVLTSAAHAKGDAVREYWRSRPPEERLAAVEFLRRQHGETDAGLRRGIRVVDRQRG